MASLDENSRASVRHDIMHSTCSELFMTLVSFCGLPLVSANRAKDRRFIKPLQAPYHEAQLLLQPTTLFQSLKPLLPSGERDYVFIADMHSNAVAYLDAPRVHPLN